ncbi:ThiF family adenylyltransferase [Rhizobium leguminosarum]|nr:ThiF family adenylyltransferase [Rhizobium leguminosarum]
MLIGAGAIGSAVAENLIRSGAQHLAVLDSDLLEVGNLSRHTLRLMDCGWPKASALAEFLAGCMPDIEVQPFVSIFPPEDEKIADALTAFDVIIDCTGSDAVLDSMSLYDWGSEKLFISLSIGWGARDFFCYSASEAIFPAVDAKAQFATVPSHRPDAANANREGIGCWHPVFSATADDINLWSAIGTKFIQHAVATRERTCRIYTLAEDGTVSLKHAS